MKVVNVPLPIVSATADLGGLNPLESQDSIPDQTVVAVCGTRLRDFSAYWDLYRVSVRAYLSSMLPNKSDIEDCVQEVALIAWKKAPVDEGERAFLGHCLASARLVGLAASRKLGRSRVQFLPPDVAQALADEVIYQEQAENSPSDRILALRACMSRLDDKQRHLLGLRYAEEGRTALDQVARSEGKTPEALYKKLERLRASLRECVTRRMGGGDENS